MLCSHQKSSPYAVTYKLASVQDSKNLFPFSLHCAVEMSAVSIVAGLGHEAKEIQVPVREGTVKMKRDEENMTKKKINELHLFPSRMLEGKHDRSLQICKRPLHRQVEKAVFPAHGSCTGKS